MKELDEIIEEHGDKIPIRETYYLNHWYYYKKHLKELDPLEVTNARRLFRGLKGLDPEERDFLALKYDQGMKRPIDKAIADELGMSLKAYREKRRIIQEKLKEIMETNKLEEMEK